MAYLIGVDGGGSKTIALIAGRDGTILGRGSGGSSNYRAVGIERTCDSLEQALRGAFADAGLEPDGSLVEMACFGLAGVDRPGDSAPLLAWAEEAWPGMRVEIVNDARLGLAAGTPQGWGLGVICGTGSIVYGRDPQGQMARAGGWGYLLGDEGSGYDIGLTALRSVARAADGRGPQTMLSELILAQWSLRATQELVEYVYRPQVTKTDIAGLTNLVEAAARQGDAVARRILEKAGHELATAAAVVVERLKLAGEVPCALVGGLLVRGELVTEEFLRSAAGIGLRLHPVERVAEPALGAVRLAGERARQGDILT